MGSAAKASRQPGPQKYRVSPPCSARGVASVIATRIPHTGSVASRTPCVASGATTPDGDFTLEEVECLALCGDAPCLTVNWRFFGRVTPNGFDVLVDDLRAGRLADEVPPHGTLCRVRRNGGLRAGAPGDEGGPPAPPMEVASSRAPGGAAPEEKGEQAEAQPADEGATEEAAGQAKQIQEKGDDEGGPAPQGDAS